MDRRTYLRTAGVFGLGLGAGCLGGRANADAASADVTMSVVAFRPDVVEVTAGDTVVWGNTSKQGHTVTTYEDRIPEDASFFASGGFGSEAAAVSAWKERSGGRLEPHGGTFEHTFEVPGTYTYYCIPHEQRGMTGVVQVEPGE